MGNCLPKRKSKRRNKVGPSPIVPIKERKKEKRISEILSGSNSSINTSLSEEELTMVQAFEPSDEERTSVKTFIMQPVESALDEVKTEVKIKKPVSFQIDYVQGMRRMPSRLAERLDTKPEVVKSQQQVLFTDEDEALMDAILAESEANEKRRALEEKQKAAEMLREEKLKAIREKAKENSSALPVIVHKSLTNPDVISTLRQRHFLIRPSESVVPGSVIFPLSAGVAFLIVSLDQVTCLDSHTQRNVLTAELTQRVENFIKVHRHCYMLCKAPIHGVVERQIYSLIQQRYLTTKLQLIPVHNIQEAVTSMVTIAKGLCKSSADVLFSRLEEVVSSIQHSDIQPSALKILNLNNQEILTVHEHFRNIPSVASASEAEFLHIGLDKRSANRLSNFFSY